MAVMPDEELIPAVTKYMQENPYTTRAALRRKFSTSVERLEKLANNKQIPPLPLSLDLKSAAIMAARISPWRDNLKLKGTPTNGRRTKPVRRK